MSAVVVLGLCNAGCSVVGHWVWPTDSKTVSFRRTTVARVHSSPPGAYVSDASGRRLGVTPFDYRVGYRVTQTYRRHNSTGWALGCLVDAGILGYALGVGFSQIDGPPPGELTYNAILGVGFGGVVGCALTWARRRGWLGRVGAVKASHKTESVTSGTKRLRMVWPDGATSSATLRVPRQRAVAALHPRGTSFDQSLVQWVIAGNQPTDPEAIFRVGQAFRRRYGVTRAPRDRTYAISYLKRYLTGDAIPAERRHVVERQLRALSKGNR